MGRDKRNIGGMCFCINQLYAQLINSGESNNQKGEVYIENSPEDKKK